MSLHVGDFINVARNIAKHDLQGVGIAKASTFDRYNRASSEGALAWENTIERNREVNLWVHEIFSFASDVINHREIV